MAKLANKIHPAKGISTRSHRQKAAHGEVDLWKNILWAFVGGVIAGLLALAISAWLFANTSLSLGLVRPFACGAAALGAVVSGWLLAKWVGRQFLLCGIGFGCFYSVCQWIASIAMNGSNVWRQENLMMPIALILGGLLGGALAALRAVR